MQPSGITQYVSMLKFSADATRVVLLTKNRPKFLNGKLCPVGGHIEEGESPEDAAAREDDEETGVKSQPSDWKKYAECEGPDWVMHCYVSFTDDADSARTMTEEPVSIHNVAELLTMVATTPECASPDLLALVGLALQARNRPSFARLSYA